MPQTLTREWREELQPNPEHVHKTWLHRIGNLTITGYNSEYSNSSFTAKKTVKDGFDSSPYRLNEQIKSTSTWTEDDIRRRNEALTELALAYCPMIDTDFEPVREPLPALPLGDDTSFTNRVIVSYEFDGRTVTVKNFKEMTSLVIRQLLAEHREAIYEYASSNGLGFTAGKVGSTRYQREVEPELWVTLRNSTDEKMAILRGLFNYLEIDTSELVFTLRPRQQEESDEDEENPFDELIKFAPQFESLEGTDATENDIAELRAEFMGVFSAFEVDGWEDVTNGRQYADLAGTVAAAELSVEEVLAGIMMVKTIESLVPGIFLQAVTDGALGRWLNRIAALTASKKTSSGRSTAAMWRTLSETVESIPAGRWVSYGDLAKVLKSAAQPVGNYLAANPVKNAHRVLRSDGTVSEKFDWLDDRDRRSPMEVLRQEGVRFDDAGRAAPEQRLPLSE